MGRAHDQLGHLYQVAQLQQHRRRRVVAFGGGERQSEELPEDGQRVLGWLAALGEAVNDIYAHWRDLDVTPPPRQERRMVKIARKMRWEPWLLTDPQVIRDGARSKRVRPTDPPVPAGATIDCSAHPTVLRLPLETARR